MILAFVKHNIKLYSPPASISCLGILSKNPSSDSVLEMLVASDRSSVLVVLGLGLASSASSRALRWRSSRSMISSSRERTKNDVAKAAAAAADSAVTSRGGGGGGVDGACAVGWAEVTSEIGDGVS
jgi:hypothetical protein